MYLQHFGLRTQPFSITPDTAFVCPTRAQSEALNTLLIAVDSGEGFIKISGEVGTGKTLLCRRLLARLEAANEQRLRWRSVYVPNPCLSPRSLLIAIAVDLKLRVSEADPERVLLDGLNRALLQFAANGDRVVVCLDEAQAMPVETLEALRLLSNLETEKRKLLQVVLFGQRELDELLARPNLRQLRSRIAFHYRLLALSPEETEAYLAHRLKVAGRAGPPLFGTRAARALHRGARGLPRTINIIAHKSLLLAYGRDAAEVSCADVREAVADSLLLDAGSRGSWLGLRLPSWWRWGHHGTA